MKRTFLLIICLISALCMDAQIINGRNFGIDGFAAYSGVEGNNWYHAGGTTGGQGGTVVYADNFAQLQAYLQSSKPYIVLVDHDITTGIDCYIDSSSKGHLCDAQDGSEGVKSTYGERIMVASNKTLIGINKDGKAPLFSRITFVMQCQSNVIIRNCRFTMLGAPILKNGENKIVAWRDGVQVETGDPDCIGIQADQNSAKTDFSSHIWIDHCEFFNGDADNKDRYDGLLDCKNNVQWLTVSYNYFHDHDKACLWGKGNSDIYDGCRTISAHHNYYKDIDGSRLPLQRGGQVHYMNNYQENCSDGWDLRSQAVCYADACYFKDTKAPILPDGGEGATLNINTDEGFGIIYDNCRRVITSPFADAITFINDPAKHDAEYDLTSYSCVGSWVPTQTASTYFINNHDSAKNVPQICETYSGAGKIDVWQEYAESIPAASADEYQQAIKTQLTASCFDNEGNKVASVASGSSSGSSTSGGNSGSSTDGETIFTLTISSSASDLSIQYTADTKSISSYCSTLTGGTAYIGLRADASSAQKVIGSDSSQRHIRTPKNDIYLQIVLDQPLKEGDVISFTGNATASNEICFMADNQYSNEKATSSKQYTVSATDTELIGKTTLYVSRAQSSNTYINSLTITRPVSSSINVVKAEGRNNQAVRKIIDTKGRVNIVKDGKNYSASGTEL